MEQIRNKILIKYGKYKEPRHTLPILELSISTSSGSVGKTISRSFSLQNKQTLILIKSFLKVYHHLLTVGIGHMQL